MYCRYRFEELECVLNGHIEDFCDVSSFVFNLQRLTVVALAFADVTGDVDIRQKVHFNLGHTVTLAGLTASATDIETKAAWLVATRTCFLRAGKELTNRRGNTCIGRRVRAGRPTNRRLINVDTFIKMIESRAVAVRCGA